jgi:hypothetical protein
VLNHAGQALIGIWPEAILAQKKAFFAIICAVVLEIIGGAALPALIVEVPCDNSIVYILKIAWLN